MIVDYCFKCGGPAVPAYSTCVKCRTLIRRAEQAFWEGINTQRRSDVWDCAWTAQEMDTQQRLECKRIMQAIAK